MSAPLYMGRPKMFRAEPHWPQHKSAKNSKVPTSPGDLQTSIWATRGAPGRPEDDLEPPQCAQSCPRHAPPIPGVMPRKSFSGHSLRASTAPPEKLFRENTRKGGSSDRPRPLSLCSERAARRPGGASTGVARTSTEVTRKSRNGPARPRNSTARSVPGGSKANKGCVQCPGPAPRRAPRAPE